MELNPGEPTAAEILNILGARYRVGPRAGTAKEGCSADGWAEGQGRPDSAAQSSCSSAPPALPQVGYELKDEIERKFDKWQEPPPVKQVKPLPAPLDGQRKKRGGRRWGPGDLQVWWGGQAGREVACTDPPDFRLPLSQVPQDEGAAGADRDPEAGQPHELWGGQTPNDHHCGIPGSPPHLALPPAAFFPPHPVALPPSDPGTTPASSLFTGLG